MGEDYDTYNTLYHGDEFKLAKEAAGKLLAKHLLQGGDIPSKPYKNLLQRVIQAVKGFFQKLSASPIPVSYTHLKRGDYRRKTK